MPRLKLMSRKNLQRVRQRQSPTPEATEIDAEAETDTETETETDTETEGETDTEAETDTETVVSEDKPDPGKAEVSLVEPDAVNEAAKTLPSLETEVAKPKAANEENSNEDTLIIVDDEESATETTEFIIIDDGGSSETSFETYFEPTGRFRGDYRTRALWDVVHEGDAEDVFEWWQQLNLYLKYQFAEQWDTVAEIDTRYGVVGEAPQENPFWGVNVSYSKWLSEVSLRQGYLRWRDAGWEISFGSRVFVWGK